MLIGIDASRANHEQKTGVEWYAWHIIEKLKTSATGGSACGGKSKAGDLQFVLYSDEPLRGELGIMPPGWSSKVLRWPPKRLWTQVRLSIEMLLHPPDVLFIPAHVFPFIHPKKTVMTVHDVAAIRFPETYNWFERWYSVWSAERALKKLWKIIVPSAFVKRELVRELRITNYELRKFKSSMIRDSKFVIRVIHHGYDGRYKKITDVEKISSVLKKYGITQPYVLSVGRIEEKKNTVRLVGAFDNLMHQNNFQFPISNFQLVLVGKPGYGYERVKKSIELSKYRDQIKELGWVSPEDVVVLMSAAEVFVFPSLYEGFGMPLLEAFACGTPVVAGKGSCLEEVGGDACEYVDPMNTEEISEGIQKVLSSPSPLGYGERSDTEMQKNLREAGFKRLQNFSWEKAADETLRVLMNV